MHKIKERNMPKKRARIAVKGVRPDFVDFNKRIIYELKPNNPAQIKAGWRQLGRYKSAFEQQYGGQWKTVLDLY